MGAKNLNSFPKKPWLRNSIYTLYQLPKTLKTSYFIISYFLINIFIDIITLVYYMIQNQLIKKTTNGIRILPRIGNHQRRETGNEKKGVGLMRSLDRLFPNILIYTQPYWRNLWIDYKLDQVIQSIRIRKIPLFLTWWRYERGNSFFSMNDVCFFDSAIE